MNFNSCLYSGFVTHKRLTPFAHRLKYRLFYMMIDLDERHHLSSLFGFSYNRFNIMSFRDSDHGDGQSDPKQWILGLCKQHNVDCDNVKLLCFPRILGYVFNPISIWYCYSGNKLSSVLYEVRNTYGEKHCYFFPNVSHEHECVKNFYVSPFIDLRGQYKFTLKIPVDHLYLNIKHTLDEGLNLIATLSLKKCKLSKWFAVRYLFKYPLLTIKVIIGIHWEALKIVRKGGFFRKRPPPPPNLVSVIYPDSDKLA